MILAYLNVYLPMFTCRVDVQIHVIIAYVDVHIYLLVSAVCVVYLPVFKVFVGVLFTRVYSRCQH